MAREKPNYRDMLSFLNCEKNVPAMMTRGEAAGILGISRNSVNSLINGGQISIDKITNKIPIGSIARYLCG